MSEQPLKPVSQRAFVDTPNLAPTLPDEIDCMPPLPAVTRNPPPMPPVKPAKVEGYESLERVLRRAYEQAAIGKGSDRHADGRPFDKQPMQTMIDLYGVGFAFGQAGKKMEEAQRMEPNAAVAELLGAINYIAGAIINIEKTK